MEKRQGLFSALKREVVRGLSPARSRERNPAEHRASMSSFMRWRKGGDRTAAVAPPMDMVVGRSGSFVRPTPEQLEEGSEPDGPHDGRGHHRRSHRLPTAATVELSASSSSSASENEEQSELRLLLGVLGAPLAPVHVSALEPRPHLSIKNTPIETSAAYYILQQYTAASGGETRQSSIHNSYAVGQVRMIVYQSESCNEVKRKKKSSKAAAESGGFVLRQMNPDMWYVELGLGKNKVVRAGCNGDIVWRHTPWRVPHAAKGPARPLRRALQGLDPRTTARMFATARCIGEKKMNGQDCFILKLSADSKTLKARSEGDSEIIRHVLFGYFNQKTGLLIHLEDSHLTRIQINGSEAVYWEFTINSFLDHYKPVNGIMIAHSGQSIGTLFRFGDTVMSHHKTTIEENWVIEEVAFNVPNLSPNFFVPPEELKKVGTERKGCNDFTNSRVTSSFLRD